MQLNPLYCFQTSSFRNVTTHSQTSHSPPPPHTKSQVCPKNNILLLFIFSAAETINSQSRVSSHSPPTLNRANFTLLNRPFDRLPTTIQSWRISSSFSQSFLYYEIFPLRTRRICTRTVIRLLMTSSSNASKRPGRNISKYSSGKNLNQ